VRPGLSTRRQWTNLKKATSELLDRHASPAIQQKWAIVLTLIQRTTDERITP
jgi:hypothetical protein